MPEETTPAMTAKGWREVLDTGATCVYPSADVVVGDTPHSDLRFHVGANVVFEARDRERHALAALALLGQPFGFTREEADFLRIVVGWAAESFDRDHFPGASATDGRFQAAAAALAKITALLPPK